MTKEPGYWRLFDVDFLPPTPASLSSAPSLRPRVPRVRLTSLRLDSIINIEKKMQLGDSLNSSNQPTLKEFGFLPFVPIVDYVLLCLILRT